MQARDSALSTAHGSAVFWRRIGRSTAIVLFVLCGSQPPAFSQTGSSLYGTFPGAIPLINVGGNGMDTQFFTLDFAEKTLQGQNQHLDPREIERRKTLIATGAVSPLDLEAPQKATFEFNQATALLRGRQSQEAIAHLQKAVTFYPKFVTAHNYLGMAYQDTDDVPHARTEYETAAKLDDRFAATYVNLGRLELSQNNFPAARSYLQKASKLRPADAGILTALAYAQNGDHKYQDVLDTVAQVHTLKHDGMGNAHYVAAAAAISLTNYPVAQSEFALFLQEDPDNPMAANARYNLDVLNKNQQAIAAAKAANPSGLNAVAAPPKENAANSDRLKRQLAEAGAESGGGPCTDCGQTTIVADAANGEPSAPDASRPTGGAQFTIRKVVDEVAVFFGVTSGGRIVSGLTLSDIAVHDDNKPPEKVLQFSPQSKLPLRIGLLIDTSGSVQPRFAFEKKAAAKFLQQMLSNEADLGFVIGFANRPTVVTDFTADQAKLAQGIQGLTNGGGTALFDAISYSCWKLAAYPERQRAARVLVVLSDGEENSSRTSLRQTIRDMEATGVTVYTISTKESQGATTEADKVLKTLAERSGGEAFFPGDLSTLSKSFDRLRDEIRSRYLIAYRPADFETNGKYRTIAITAEKDGKHLQVHARKGYHVRVESATP